MSWFHNLNSDVQNVIKWFAAEFQYLRELRDDLERIKRDTTVSDQEKDYKKVRRAWYYVRRCERRAERNVEKVIEDLKLAIQTNPNLVTLEKQIEISSEKLLKAFSFYTGDFQKKLIFLALQFQTRHKYFGNKAKEAELNIKNTASEIEQYLDTLIQWVGGLETNLKQVVGKLQKVGSGEEVSVFKFTDTKGDTFIVKKPNREFLQIRYTSKEAALFGELKGISYIVANILFPENSIKLIKIKPNGTLVFEHYELTPHPEKYYNESRETWTKFNEAGINTGSFYDYYINKQGKFVFYDLYIEDIDKLSNYIRRAKIPASIIVELQNLIEQFIEIQRYRRK